MMRMPSALNKIGIDLDAQALKDFEGDYPVELINGCAYQFLAGYHISGIELIYCDPP